MKMRDMSLLGAFAACVCVSDTSVATVRQRAILSFALKPAESLLFQQIACTDRYGVLLEKAEASDEAGTEKLDDSKSVNVRCHSHRRIEGQPVKYLVECRRADLASAWECDPGRESMVARVGGILVHITIQDGSTANLDQAFVIVKYLRSSGQLKDELVEESQVPGEEGFASCHTFPRYSDRVEMVRCFGVNDVPLTRAEELQP
jgi:hypothetical protein